MNLFTVLLPYLVLICAIFLFKPFMCGFRKLAKVSISAFFLRVRAGAEHQRSRRSGNRFQTRMETVIRLIISGLYFLFFLIVLFYFSQWLIRAKSTENYQTLTTKANVVVAFGFGIEDDGNGHLAAEAANDSIMKWVTDNTNPEFIIAQKGCGISKYISPKAHVIEMHPLNLGYVNTFDAANYALSKLDSLENAGVKVNINIIVAAHNMQIERAAWILNTLKNDKKHKTDYQFVVPKMPEIPFPSKSGQLHTRNKFIYTLVELYISRPRDYFHSLKY